MSVCASRSVAMPKNTVYLEAPHRTQDLLNIKWALRSAGYTIGSTWHDSEPGASAISGNHWNARRVEELQICDSLVVICGKGNKGTLELAMMAGFALARGLRVIWIAAPLLGLTDFRAVQLFDTPEDFRKHILNQMYAHSTSVTAEPIAA